MKSLNEYAAIVNAKLEALFPDKEGAPILESAMRYSVMAGGKRLRPSMLLAACDMLGGDMTAALDFASAVEMIHTYSLIHDDLPGMDNDTLRRGRPTCHVAFSEGQAILAGDGLLNLAFETMLKSAAEVKSKAYARILAMREIATGAGVTGMILGQCLDLASETSRKRDPETLEAIQYGKTACMFIYPLRAAARLSGADDNTLAALTAYGRAFGLLFQAMDDLLDILGSPDELGKSTGKDAVSGKLTCVSVYGIDGTRKLIREQRQAAIDALDGISADAAFFAELVNAMADRTK